MADIITLNPGEKDIGKIVQAIRQLAERFQPSEDLAAGALLAANNLSDVANATTSRGNLGLATSTTDNTIIRANGTAGGTQGSGIIIDDSDIVYGGSAAGSDLELRSTSNGTPSGDEVIVKGTTITLRTHTTGTTTINLGVGGTTGCLTVLAGTTSGAVTLRSTTGTYNFVFPSTAGNAGEVLTSGGGGTTPMTWAPASVVLQCLQTTYATNTDLTTTIPLDDTTPTNTEGTEVLSQAITPTDNTNKILVEAVIHGAVNTNNVAMSVAVFRGSTCIDAKSHTFTTSNFPAVVSSKVLDSPTTTSATTYSVRVGPSSNTLRLNGTTASRHFGGTAICTLTVSEISA